jgi:hypothetical protein
VEVDGHGATFVITTPSDLTPASTTNSKRFTCSEDVEINYGSYVLWHGAYWLVTAKDFDDEIFQRGIMELCNYQLKWQNERGEVVSRWVLMNAVTKYSSGIFEGKIIDVPDATIACTLPYDEETIKIRLDRRFIADVSSDNPYVYRVTQRDVLSKHYDGHGIVTLALTQAVFNGATDDTDIMVADYVTPPSESTVIGLSEIRLGRTAVYTSSQETPTWTISDADNITTAAVVEGATLKVTASSDKASVGKTFTVSDGMSVFEVRVIGVY